MIVYSYQGPDVKVVKERAFAISTSFVFANYRCSKPVYLVSWPSAHFAVLPLHSASFYYTTFGNRLQLASADFTLFYIGFTSINTEDPAVAYI